MDSITNLFRLNDALIIFDVGAYHCERSIEFYKRFKNAKIYAFECNPELLDICRKKIEKYQDRITLIEHAVGDYDGVIRANTIYDSEDYIRCVRLDTILREYRIQCVDIICTKVYRNNLVGIRSLGEYLENVRIVYSNVSGRIKEIQTFMSVENNFRLMTDSALFYCNAKMVNDSFDVVIPVGPSDLWNICDQVEHVKQNVVGYRNLYIISCDPDIWIDNCITISEDAFPFSVNTVTNIHGKHVRNRWYFQQLLKLYAWKYIPDILPRYLVIDSDTYFLKPTVFIDANTNQCLYNYEIQPTESLHIPYFIHMQRLGRTAKNEYKLHRVANVSCITRHMMFETKYLIELIELVENIRHNTRKKTFYEIYLENVDISYVTSSGASEYELYLNFVLKYHDDQILLRQLKWKEVVWEYGILTYPPNIDYISCK
jgi:hypothetical protein